MPGREGTAPYSASTRGAERCFTFYCALSGRLVCEVRVAADKFPVPGDALAEAWRGARPYFNRCVSCGRWVADTAYNIDELRCADCAPRKEEARLCASCGESVPSGSLFCAHCGRALSAAKETPWAPERRGGVE